MKTKNPFTTYLQGYSGLFWGCNDKESSYHIQKHGSPAWHPVLQLY